MSKIHELAFDAEEIDELLDSVDKKTIYQDATQSEHGLMSTTDKTKLDALPTAQQIEGSLSEKVDNEEGKGLSKNDYTDAEKESVASAYHKPQNGIPKTDLDSSVQTSLDNADTALQSFTETDPTVPSWAKQPNKPSYDYSEIGNTPDLSGFITKSVNDLTNYYLKSETYTKAEVAALIGAIQQFHYEIYATLPSSGESNVLYLIGPTGTGSDRYEEYVYANNAFTKIGDTSIDLSGYVTTSALNTALADYTTTSNLTALLSNKTDKVSNATNGNFAGLDANGNLTDSGKKASDFLTQEQAGRLNHFKGWYDSSSNLPANPVVGDYAYVKGATSTDPAAIYECTTAGSWSDSGRTADTSNVQTFASDQEVNEVHIVNDLTTGGVNDVLSAEQGIILNEKFIIENIEEELATNSGEGYIRFKITDSEYPLGVNVPNYTGLTDEEILSFRDKYYVNIPTKRSLSIGYYTQTRYFGYCIAAVNPYDKIIITANQNYPCFYSVLSSNIDVSNNPQSFATGYNTVYQINAGESLEIDIPSDGHYIYLYRGYVGDSDERQHEIFLPASIKRVTVKVLSTWSQEVNDRLDSLEEKAPTDIDEAVAEALKEDSESVKERTIFELNPDIEMKQKLVLLNKGYFVNASLPEATPRPLIFAHISDVHGDYRKYQRYCDFCNHWKADDLNQSNRKYIVDFLDSGDIVSSNYGQYMDALYGVPSFGNILKAIGNHDTCASSDEIQSMPIGQNQWQYHGAASLDSTKRTDAYNKYFVGPDSSNPYISKWGVTQPSGAAENGLCYYYKDYVDNNIRLIVLDVMAYDSSQAQWFASVLSAANIAELHVVVMAHFTGELMDRVECNYSSLFLTGDSYLTLDTYGTQYTRDSTEGIVKLVDNFQANGGIFVGYISGHYHRDMINTVRNYPKQLILSVSSGGKTPIRDFTKVNSCKSYDDFQLISINAYDRTIRLCKVGADTDYYMRKKRTLCVSYEVVNESGTDKVKGVIGEG